MAKEEIVGRQAELDRLRAAVAAARSGRPTVVLLVGGAGAGKSSLLAAALAGDDAGDAVVVTASGDEAEVDLDYGILDQLRRGLPVGAEARREMEPEPGADPRKVGSALLRLIDEAQLGHPLVVVVDDAQWADPASLEALTFGARRLRAADTVLLVVACRSDGVDQLPPGLVRLAEEGGHLVEVTPLGDAEVAELARRRYGRALPPAAVERLRAHTGGNPLHTRSLLDDLPYEAVARPGSLPAPRSYAGLVLGRLAGCSPAAQGLLTALAVLGARAPLAEVARVAEVDDPLPAAEELTSRDLAALVPAATGWVLAFPHGLVQASVATDLSPSRRAALHARAARVTAGDESLRHRLAAAHGPDAALVAEARAAADARAAAGSRSVAARLLLDAAPLAVTPGEREQLVVDAAVHLVVAGQSLGRLADEIAGFPDSAHRSYVLGRLALASGSLGEAEQMLTRAWQQANEDPAAADLAGPAADLLAVLALHQRRPADTSAWARRALDAGSESTTSATMLCHGLALDGGFAAAEGEMTALLETDGRPAVIMDALLGRGVVRVWANDLDGARADLAEVARRVEDRGPFLAEADVRSFMAEVDFRAGRWAEALDRAEAAASIVDDAGEVWLESLPHGLAASVLAALGRIDEARRHAEAAGTAAEATGLMPARLWSQHAWLRIAAARGDHAEVVAVGDRMLAEGWDGVPEGVHHWHATYAESLVALGRLPAAAAAVEALAAQAAAAPGDASIGAELARARGLVAAASGDAEAADAAFAAGLALDPVASRPFERARLELAAGAHQRRTGRRRAAAELLGRAADRFDALGAGPWAQWCAEELERCGLRPKKRSEARDAELTAQERLVARLVATGLTNREVASELVISAKTVEHHLSRVYAKLGLRSRTELAAQLGPTA